MQLRSAGRGWGLTIVVVLCGVTGPVVSDSHAQDETPILALDAGGHTDFIRKLVFTPDGKELITVSKDKTIRFWDVASGNSLGVMRPPIGPGPEGVLRAVAVSPDGRLLAVGGYPPRSGRDDNPIYVISLAEERVTRLLLGHTKSIEDLQFSHDGRRLISGSLDHTARVWNVVTGQTEHVLQGHKAAVYGVTFSPDDRHCATASYDGTAALWSVATGAQVTRLVGHSEEVGCVDWSPDGTHIATGSSDTSVRIWNSTGQLIRTFNNLGSRLISAVRFTDDGRRLLFVQGSGSGAYSSGIIDLASGKQVVRFGGETYIDGQLSPDGRLVATNGVHDGKADIWSATDGNLVTSIAGQGRATWSATWNAESNTIAWGNTYGAADKFSDPGYIEPIHSLEHAFDLTQLEYIDFAGQPLAEEWRRAITTKGSTKLVSSSHSSVAVRQGQQTITTLQPTDAYNQSYDTIRSYTLLTRNRAAVGSNFGLWVYDTRTGKRLRECVGHTGIVWAVSPSPNGRYLLSASHDMTLRVWDINTPGDADIEPLVSLFFADDEWIAWTPEGYYAASPGGERLMGWHVNNGRDQLASFYPASQFRKQFYRPDVIKLLLRTGSVERALEIAGSRGAVKSVARNLPPNVEILAPDSANSTADSEEITVRVRVTQTGSNPITSLQLLLDGRPLNGRAGVMQVDTPSETITHRFHVPLVPNVEHTIQARANSDVSYGLSRVIRTTYEPPNTQPQLPALYVLAIGVSDYDDESLKLNYADDDARRLAKTIQDRSFDLYDKIDTRMVVDKDATQKGVLAGLVWLKEQMTQHDVGVLFFSGHGARDETGNFYLLPSDVDTSNSLLLSAVADSQIKGILQSTPGRLIVMLDACHAGVLGGDRRKGALTDDLVRDLANDDFGVVVMASSTGREFSLESLQERSGMFTLAICEGLAGEADYNDDTHIYFDELDAYVSSRVKELSQGKQHPVTAKPATIRPFPLSTRAK